MSSVSSEYNTAYLSEFAILFRSSYRKVGPPPVGSTSNLPVLESFKHCCLCECISALNIPIVFNQIRNIICSDFLEQPIQITVRSPCLCFPPYSSNG